MLAQNSKRLQAAFDFQGSPMLFRLLPRETETMSRFTPAIDDDERDEEEEEEEFHEDENDEDSFSPIFSPFLSFGSIELAVSNDNDSFGFSLQSVISALRLDFYGCVKLINFLRAQVQLFSPSIASPMTAAQVGLIVASLKRDAPFFSEESFLKPATSSPDSFLCNIDYFLPDDEDDDGPERGKQSPSKERKSI